MRIRQAGIGLALVAAGTLAILWLSTIPLGVPGEWAWSRIPAPAGDWTLLVLGWVSAAVVGGLYLGFVVAGSTRLDRASRWESAAWLAGLCAMGFAWLWALQESPADPQNALGKSGWVVYYPAHEGYFAQARYQMPDVGSYLAGYEKEMTRGDYFHLGTHPPGLMLFHRACINLCAASPGLSNLLEQTEPRSFRDAMDVTVTTEQRGHQPLTPADTAAIWLATLVTQFVAVATVIPLFLLVRRTDSPTTSWWTAALWPLVPALAIFLPKSDAILPFFGVLFLCLWLDGFRRGSWLLCALSGIVFFLSMCLSLAILPIAVAAVLLTVWEALLCRKEERAAPRYGDWAVQVAAAAAGWGIPVILSWLLGHINLVAVWRWNLRNHAAFYDHFTRTYWKWLLANPLEAAFAVGAPIVFALVVAFRNRLKAGWRQRAMGPYWCLTATWAVLWLTGKNMGEAARLWLIFVPWAVWFTAAFFAPLPTKTDANSSGVRRIAVLLFFFQLIVAIGTVTRVTGFEFPKVPDAKTVSIRERLKSDVSTFVAADAIRPSGR
jgi:methylthioxylose transferase